MKKYVVFIWKKCVSTPGWFPSNVIVDSSIFNPIYIKASEERIRLHLNDNSQIVIHGWEEIQS